MNIPVLQSALVLLLIGVLTENKRMCPFPWNYYKVEGVCIRSFQFHRNWTSSRDFCKGLKGNLVQIWDQNKENYVKQIREYKNDRYTIGATAWDEDREITYLNGTVLTWTFATGWGNSLKPRCVELSALEIGWNIIDCKEKRMFICEVVAVSFPESNTALRTMCIPEPEMCICEKELWTYIEDNKKYIVRIYSKKTFSDSAFLCENFGGRLLVNPDELTLRLLSDIHNVWSREDTSYRVGLHKKRSQWVWVDGANYTKDWFHRWHDYDNEEKACAVIRVDTVPPTWITSQCVTRQPFICEAKVPCGPSFVLRVDGSKKRNNSDLLVINENIVRIQCSLRNWGDRNMFPLMDIFVFCGTQSSLDENTDVHAKSFHININMHGKRCGCELLVYDRTVNRHTVRVYFKSPPRLVNVRDNKKSFSIHKDGRGVIVFQIYANPRPKINSLGWDGGQDQDADQDTEMVNYTASITPLVEKVNHYTVTIVLNRVRFKHAGMYALVIANDGFDQRLEYFFELKVTAKPLSLGMYSYSLLLPALANLIGLFLILMFVLRSMRHEKYPGDSKSSKGTRRSTMRDFELVPDTEREGSSKTGLPRAMSFAEYHHKIRGDSSDVDRPPPRRILRLTTNSEGSALYLSDDIGSAVDIVELRPGAAGAINPETGRASIPAFSRPIVSVAGMEANTEPNRKTGAPLPDGKTKEKSVLDDKTGDKSTSSGKTGEKSNVSSTKLHKGTSSDGRLTTATSTHAKPSSDA